VNTTLVLTTMALTLYGPATNGQLLLTPTSLMTTQVPGYYEGQVALTIGSAIQTAFNPLPFQIGAKF
jgi:hypothetical protein